MRRISRLRLAGPVLLAAGLLVSGPATAEPFAESAQSAAAGRSSGKTTAVPYDWRNARIDGGGFVPGIVFNRSEPGLAYARTDIGGAYRWRESDKTWTPLLDSVGWDDWGHTGVASIASDPVEPDRVYAAAGTYTNDWDPGNGAVYRSADRGATWQKSPLPFKLGGNMPGRGMGERLAVDPHDNDVLYVGAPSGHGLWRSTDAGATFARVSGVDEADTIGFGKAAPGATYQALYTSARIGGVRGIFRSTDAGATWERINDDAHQWGRTGAAITGDPRVFGRVYVSTNGRGVVYGDVSSK